MFLGIPQSVWPFPSKPLLLLATVALVLGTTSLVILMVWNRLCAPLLRAPRLTFWQALSVAVMGWVLWLVYYLGLPILV